MQQNTFNAAEEEVFVFPASFAQQRLWFLDQLAPGRATYTIPMAIRFSGSLDLTALAQSLSEIVYRHEALRTTFRVVDGSPVQVVAASSPNMRLPVIDLQGSPVAEADVQRYIHDL